MNARSQTTRRRLAPVLLVFATFAFAGGAGLRAQVQAGRIVGTVYDPSHAEVPHAIVDVKNSATNVSQTVRTNGTGDYVVTPLDPGVHSVSASAPGFQTTVRTAVTLQVGEAVRVDLSLQLGQTSTVVQVRAALPLLNTESGTLGQIITNRQIVDLPLNGRGFYLLAQLTPGAAQLPGTGNVLRIRPEFINGTTISGIRGRMITYLLDGFDVTEQHQGGTYIQTSIDDLQEFRVQQNGYSAEYSRAGAILNATSKSGTNQFHGDAFEFLRNDKLDARNFFAPSREPLRLNQFGGTLGGPVTIPKVYKGRDRTFFFASYEGTRQGQGLVFDNIVPTAAMRTGDFSARGLPIIYDPSTTRPNPSGSGVIRTPFSGNSIPPGKLSSQALFFNKYIPAPNSPGGTAVFTPAQTLNLNQFTIRLDQTLTQKQRLFFRWSFDNNDEHDPNAFPVLGIAPLHTRGQDVAVSLTSNLTPNTINEARFNYLPSVVNLKAYLQGPDFNALAGVTGFEQTLLPGVGGSFPDFGWSGFSPLRGSQFDQRPKTQNRKEIEGSDNLTWIKGRHIIKYGGLFRHYVWLGTDSANYVGSWSFSGINTENPLNASGTGSSFADWMLGYPASGARAFPGKTFGGTGNYWQFFVQDDVKVSNRLTLNLGVRYEYSPWMSGYRGQLGTFDPSSPKPIIDASHTDQLDLGAQYAAPSAYAIFGRLIQTSHQAGLPYNITFNDDHQWGPRFGLSWRPFGDKTVVRGGYGIFYEPENTDGRVNKNMLPFLLSETAFNSAAATPQRTFANFFLGQPIGSLDTAPSLIPTPAHMNMGYDQHWNFGVQQELGLNNMLEIDYVGNKGTFLNSGDAVNDPPAGPGAIQARRPYPTFGGISYDSQDMTTAYNALQASFQRRYTAGLWFLASYTYSNALQRLKRPVLGGDSVFSREAADYNIPQNFAFSAGYQLPMGNGHALLGSANKAEQLVFGGWQTQAILDFHSGLPFTPTISRDVANIGVGGQRPFRTGSGVLSDPTVNSWFKKADFTVPANFTYGDSGGNILRADFYKDFDFSLFKNFQVTEHSRFEFRAEFFNITNTPIFGGPNTQIDTSSGGRVTSTANNPRQIQFALKYVF